MNPSRQKTYRNAADNKKNDKISKSIFFTAKGSINTAHGNTNVIFAMFEPIILPIGMLDSLIKLAFKLTTSSGKLVPKEIKVSPMIYLGMPKERPNSLTCLIIKSAPKYINKALEKN